MSFRYYQPPKQPTYSDSEEYSSDEGHKQNGRRRQDSTDNNTGTKRYVFILMESLTCINEQLIAPIIGRAHVRTARP